MILLDQIEAKFKEMFGEQPLLLRSPGRVNLIGEHTDYNDGFVLPGAIDKAIYFAITPRSDRCCRVYAIDLKDEHQFEVDTVHPSPKGWPNYLMGVIDQLRKREYKIGGFNCAFGGDIPIGAGMSSSAAIEAGLAYALNYLFDLRIENLQLVKLAQKAENEFVGVQCGIMDQYVNIFGEQNNVLRIDCRSLDYEYYPFDHDASIVLFDTRVSHSLASSEYNRRRRECNEGVEIIRRAYPRVTHLRDVSVEMLGEFKEHMEATTFRRCQYVVEENERVLSACRSLEMRDLKTFGRYMHQTHEGLRCLYGVSCDELDFLVDLVKDSPGVYGSRMMGGGFGGCTINLIEKGEVEHISNIVAEKYRQRFNQVLRTYITSISGGTSIVSVNENTTARIG